MATTRYENDRGLTRRMIGTMFGLGLLYVVLAAVLIALGFSTVFVLIIAGGGLWAQWYFSDTMALRAMRAVEVSAEQAPELHAVVDRLCALADMPKPRIAVADTDVPNAFATGRSEKRAVVCVTTGLLRRLDVAEVEGVLSHELSHIAHRDVTVMTVALSRYRELSADRTGALLTGNPSALATALQKVSGDISAIPDRDLRSMEAVSAFAFALALTSKFSMSTLFMTHPPLEKRLEQLAQISTQLGQR